MKPNVIDNVIAHISPGWAARRLRSRYTYSALSGFGYESARGGKNSMFRWGPGNGSADRDTLPDLPKLRAQSRDLERNNPLAKGAINTVVTSVVGTGLTVQSRVDRRLLSQVLGLSDDQMDDAEAAIEREWKMWAQSTACDVTDTLDFNGMQDLVMRATLQSGDVFSVDRFIDPYVQHE